MNEYNINVENCAKEKYSWNYLIYVIQNQRFPLSRSYSQEYEYRRQREQIQQKWISVHDYVLHSIFGHTKILVQIDHKSPSAQEGTRADLPLDTFGITRPSLETKYKAAHPVEKLIKPLRVLAENDFPYYLEDNIYHLILWKLHGPITTDDIIWAKEKETPKIMKEIVPNKNVINTLHWINPQHLKSLPDIDHVHIVCLVSDCNQDYEILNLVKERTELRKQNKWSEADMIKTKLNNFPFMVDLTDLSDCSTVWERINDKYLPSEKRILWSTLDILEPTFDPTSTIPLVIATVDTPNYRKRLHDTKVHLTEISLSNTILFDPLLPIDLLDIDKVPSIGTRRILYEGWRQILLPRLHELSKVTKIMSHGFILVAEDDIRFPSGITPIFLRNVCMNAFDADSTLNVLSLGHSSTVFKTKGGTKMKYSDNLLEHLQSGGGVHGTTLLAIRVPEGIDQLLNVMNEVQVGRRTHFDQFLFHSTHHNTNVALSNPPLVGWCESEKTLTSVGPGCRRNGGGRLGHLPTIKMEERLKIRWVRRQLQ